MMAFKFLARGAVAPFTGFAWPTDGAWVEAPAGRRDVWIHACRPRDLPYWLDEELWRAELEAPLMETRYQVASARARLLARVTGWDQAARRAFAEACAWRARDQALPRLEGPLGAALADAADLEALAAAVAGAAGITGAAPVPRPAWLAADAARNALGDRPGTTSYIAAVQAESLGGGRSAFEAERAWQARWLVERLGLPAGA